MNTPQPNRNTAPAQPQPATPGDETVDVVIVGGGAAGLSGAVTLARALRRVVVIDAGAPRNAPAEGVHGFLSRDGIAPAELTAIGRAEAERYGAELRTGSVEQVTRHDDGLFAVALADGGTLRARRLLITSGSVDTLPDVEGLAERWGRSALHCPYCHGWEVRGSRIAVLGTGPGSVHQSLMFRQWSEDVTLYLHEGDAPSDAERELFAARGIRVVDGPIARLGGAGTSLEFVETADGVRHPADAIVVAPRAEARLDAFASIGVVPEPGPMGSGSRIAVDPRGVSAVPGVWAAGNATDAGLQVMMAAADAVKAAAGINADLTAEAQELALAAYRSARV